MTDIVMNHRTAVVTGAGNGLGRAYALALAERGAAVVVNDLGASTTDEGADRAPADEVVEEIRRSGGRAVASYESVATVDGARAVVQQALDTFGSVDILVNNAGNRRPSPFAVMSEDDLRAVLDTHLVGSYFVTQAAFGHMKERNFGRVIFVSSNTAAFGGTGLSNYATAKAGVLGLARAVALEGHEFGIIANTVMPMARTPRSQAAHGAIVGLSGSTTGQNATTDSVEGPPPLTTDEVAPLVVALSSDKWTGTGSVYSIGYGRIAEVFTAVTRGWYPSDPSSYGAQDVIDNLKAIRDRTEFGEPTSSPDERQLIAAFAPRSAGTAGGVKS
ncbi:SDR family NAD(P)-dependent oxidoreductase [Rhodococcoides fascians]|uniref:SDR family NAD(P)-dependent oxidoreductase n=1 Tax=Rhodococcoides fascians TaxID=1828 RepID=UPI001427BA2B